MWNYTHTCVIKLGWKRDLSVCSSQKNKTRKTKFNCIAVARRNSIVMQQLECPCGFIIKATDQPLSVNCFYNMSTFGLHMALNNSIHITTSHTFTNTNTNERCIKNDSSCTKWLIFSAVLSFPQGTIVTRFTWSTNHLQMRIFAPFRIYHVIRFRAVEIHVDDFLWNENKPSSVYYS